MKTVFGILTLCFSVSVQAKTVQPTKNSFNCQVPLLKKSLAQASYFKAKTDSASWLAVDPQTSQVFTLLGLSKTAAPKFATLKNAKSCVHEKTSTNQVYGDAKKVLSFPVTNPCQEKWAKSLNLRPVPVENYGSMEAGYNSNWGQIYICTDGTKLFHCPQPSADMENCLKKL